ncbi:hypothetical protein GPROT1_03191 [Gammaproteobacteria bacterium]|nr:hypothetical protein GPROT1_03191 [Gammaproteobacteria bacterium]
MGLAGAGPAGQDQIARLAQEGGGGQLLGLGLPQGRLGPLEPGQAAVDREVRGRGLVAQPAGMAAGLPGRDEPGQPNLRAGGLLVGFGLPFGPGGGHAVEVRRLERAKPVNGHGAPPAGCRNGHSRPWVPGAMPGRAGRCRQSAQGVQHHRRGGHARFQRQVAGDLQHVQAGLAGQQQQLHEGAAALGVLQDAAAHGADGGGQVPVLERGAMAQGPRLLFQHRQAVPRVADQPAPAKLAGMHGHRSGLGDGAERTGCVMRTDTTLPAQLAGTL